MRRVALSLLIGTAAVSSAVAQPALPSAPQASPVQEQIERTLGQLFVLNAQAQAQIAAQAAQIAALKQQLEQAKQGSESKSPANANGNGAKPAQKQ